MHRSLRSVRSVFDEGCGWTLWRVLRSPDIVGTVRNWIIIDLKHNPEFLNLFGRGLRFIYVEDLSLALDCTVQPTEIALTP